MPFDVLTGIKACMEAKHPVDEEPYEVSLDVHGCCDGPKIGRIRALEKVLSLSLSPACTCSGVSSMCMKYELIVDVSIYVFLFYYVIQIVLLH